MTNLGETWIIGDCCIRGCYDVKPLEYFKGCYSDLTTRKIIRVIRLSDLFDYDN